MRNRRAFVLSVALISVLLSVAFQNCGGNQKNLTPTSLSSASTYTGAEDDSQRQHNGDLDPTANSGTPGGVGTELFRMSDLKWSSKGPIDGMTCVNFHEPEDPYGWDNNYLCSLKDYGFIFSNSGPVSGKTCLSINDGADPHGWSDNYLCSTFNYNLVFRSSGPTIDGEVCIQIIAPGDPHTWNDNFLCQVGSRTTFNGDFVPGNGITCSMGWGNNLEGIASRQWTNLTYDTCTYRCAGFGRGSCAYSASVNGSMSHCRYFADGTTVTTSNMGWGSGFYAGSCR